jgi:subtilase family serine protease
MRINSLLTAGLCAYGLVASQSSLSAPLNGTVVHADTQVTVAAASAQDVVEFSVYLPLRNTDKLEALLAQQHDETSPQYHQWLQPADFLAQFGARPADIATVRNALVARGLTIVSTNAHGVRVSGTAAAVSQAFSAPLQKVTTHSHTRFQARQGLQIPGELAALAPRVIGLGALPEHQMHSKIVSQVSGTDNRISTVGPYWFDDLKQAYDYPAYSSSTDGSSVSVAVLMTDLLFDGDVAAAFNHENFTTITHKQPPSVTTVTVDGGGVQNGDGSFEASLDVQQVLGGAPGTDVTLVSIPDLSDQSIIDGYTYIVDANKHDIVNSSFGGCELEYTAAYNGGTDYTYILQTYHEVFQQGNAQGITFVASSGDQGGLLCPSADYGTGPSPVFVPGVSSPADDPNVTAVGGGNLVTASSATSLVSSYVRESAFADPDVPYDIYGLGTNVSGGYWGAGGGVSSVFKKPAYQFLANTGSNRWRTLPDVGMQVGGCPLDLAASCGADDSAAIVAFGVGVGGGYYGVIGTSVSSPEFVGALALFEQQQGKKNHRLGNANVYLYAAGALQALAGGPRAPAALQFYHLGIPGFDGLYTGGRPSANYDYIYGNGSPDVRKLFGLTRFPAAGVPQTPGNP